MGCVYRVRVDSRGRISLPQRVLEDLGVKVGDGLLMWVPSSAGKHLVAISEKAGALVLEKEFSKSSP